jgi:hypothetical protein
VRFAISAAAAVSGLLLLGLALYGQPAVYLRQAGEEWDALMDRPVADQATGSDAIGTGAAGTGAAPAGAPTADRSAGPDAQRRVAGDAQAASERATRRQREVVRLQQELAARQRMPSPAAADSASVMPAPSGSSSPGATGSASNGPGPSGPGSPVSGPVAAAPPPGAVTPGTPGAAANSSTVVVRVPPPAAAGQTDAAAPNAATAPVPDVAAAIPVAPLNLVPERHESNVVMTGPKAERQADQGKAAAARSDLARAEPAKPEGAKPEGGRPEAGRPEADRADTNRTEQAGVDAVRPAPSRSEPVRPVAPKVALQKPIPAPPPLPQPTPPRPETNDTQSVLARLRQLAPGTPPVQQADASPPADVRPRPAVSPLLSRLSAARAALANGQIEDARRLLQQVQLQLVFGPVDSPADDPPTTGRGAADVARALEALSANDAPLSRRYIDVAVGDLSGSPTNPQIQESARRASGYAPAYPPR